MLKTSKDIKSFFWKYGTYSSLHLFVGHEPMYPTEIFFVLSTEWIGQSYPCECTTFLSIQENTVPQWTFKMNSPAATNEAWHVSGHMIIANSCISKILNRCSDTMHIPEEQNFLLLNSSYRYVTKPVIRTTRPFLSASHPPANLYSPTITRISSQL